MPLNKDMRVSHFVTYLDCKQLEIFKGARKIFLSATKIDENTTNNLNCCFSQ